MGVAADGDIACVLNSRYGHVERRDACKNPRQQRPLFHFFFRSQSGTHLSPMGIRHHQSGSLSVGHAESRKNLIYLFFLYYFVSYYVGVLPVCRRTSRWMLVSIGRFVDVSNL